MLPDEILLSLDRQLPCRELQLRRLGSLAGDFSPPILVLHGVAATGKSLTIRSILEAIDTPSAIVRSQECITTRHLLERTATLVKDSLEASDGVEEGGSGIGRCESISAFVVELQQLLEGKGQFILVFDGIDRQREAAPTLLPALARLSEIIPNLTTIFITITSTPHLYHHSSLPHIHFPQYTRVEILSILSTTPLSIHSSTSDSSDNEAQQARNHSDSLWLWTRYTAAVYDSLGQNAARDIVSFRSVCTRLWRPFIQPILDNHYGVREFSKLLVRNRGLFQSEAALLDNIVHIAPTAPDIKAPKPPSPQPLPYYPTHLLLASYLASHTPPRHDIPLFSRTAPTKRRKRGGGTALTPHRASKRRKISRKLLGPQPFPLERMLAIFHAILPHEMKGGGTDVMGMVATLVGLRLVVSAGEGGQGGKWRCGVGWEFVRGVAMGVGFDIDSYIVE